MSSERKYKSTVQDLLDEHGAWEMATHDVYRKGVPDLTAVYQGRSIWWELKWANVPEDETVFLSAHKLTAPQSKYLRDTGSRGAHAGVLVGLNDGQSFFCGHDELSPGPHREFDLQAGQIAPTDQLIEELLCDAAMDGST